MFNEYVLAEKLDKIADAINESRKEYITVGDIYKLVQDKDNVFIYKDDDYKYVEEEDFNIKVEFINAEDDYILIN